MGRNSDAIGIIVLLLLVSGLPADKGSPQRRPLFEGFEPISLISSFHKMVSVMEKIDNMGQMALNPPKLPDPSRLINTDEMPDLNGIMDMLGPVLGSLNGNSDK